MDDVLTVLVDTKIGGIRNHLQEKHGLFHHLIVCKDVFSEETELRQEDMTKSLRECGFVGSSSKEFAPQVTIFYNFIPKGLTKMVFPRLGLSGGDATSYTWHGLMHDPTLLS